MVDLNEQNKPESRNKIVVKKSILQGKVKGSDVLNAVMIAARLQAEKLVEKLNRGAPLDKDEIKSLKELAEIAKIGLPEETETQPQIQIQQQFVGSLTSAEDIKQKALQSLLENLPK